MLLFNKITSQFYKEREELQNNKPVFTRVSAVIDEMLRNLIVKYETLSPYQLSIVLRQCVLIEKKIGMKKLIAIE